jgi:hypothetical protein
MAELLETTLTTTYHGQTFVNRWNYKAEGSPPPDGFAWGLNEAMGFHPVGGTPPADTILEALMGFLSVGCAAVQAICINPYDPEDFDAQPFIPRPVGPDTAEQAAPFLAIGFRTNQTRRDIRRGTKRFSGLSELAFEDGGAVKATFIAFANTLGDKMDEVLSLTVGSDTSTYTPCVVKKDKYVVPGSDPERFAYRYLPPYDSSGRDAQLELIATGLTWEVYSDARSQVSRQYGRGI